MTPKSDDRSSAGAADDESELPRKERVIHTRVPAVLERELKRMAVALRVPVSNVVRAILEDAVEAVDRVGRKAEGEVRGIAESLAHSRGRLRGIALRADRPESVLAEPPAARPSQKGRSAGRATKAANRTELDGVLGFQPLALAQGALCAACGRKLRAGEQAYLGVRGDDGPPVIVGQECLPARVSSNDTEQEP